MNPELTRYETVFTPLTIKTVTLANRIVRTAHGIGLGGEDFIAYHEARARGGVAMSILGSGGVHPTNPKYVNPVYSDDVLPLYEEMSRRCHAYGMKVFQQLNHAGAANPSAPGVTQWSASAVPNPIIGTVPRPLTTDMIAELVEAFGTAAGRVRDGGLDGVEIHAAHGYLVSQFLSPVLNHRDDEYGGTPENRLRFLREVLSSVREHVGPDFPVGIRLVAEEWIEGGMKPSDIVAIAAAIEPQIDFLDISLGGYWRFHKMLGTSELPLGYELPAASVVSASVSVPTIVTGRIMTLDHANHILESGQADLVSMVRATIADPDLVSKARSGRDGEVRPCVGTSQGCVAGIFTPTGFGCIVNVDAGREGQPTSRLGTAIVSKKVLVVGGGPAGMEAARVAALRGHTVELHELRRELGGQLLVASAVRERADFATLVHWLESELTRLGVTIRRQSFVDPDVVVACGADEVILATGGSVSVDVPQVLAPAAPIPGAQLPHVRTAWDLLGFGRRSPVGSTVVIYDDTGTFEALTVGLHLVSEGRQVTLVTRFDFPGARIPFPPATLEATRERLLQGDVTIIPATRLAEISPNEVTVASIDTGRQRSLPADTVVVVLNHQPNRELSDALQDVGVTHHLIGDANGTEELQRAMREANLVARGL